MRKGNGQPSLTQISNKVSPLAQHWITGLKLEEKDQKNEGNKSGGKRGSEPKADNEGGILKLVEDL